MPQEYKQHNLEGGKFRGTKEFDSLITARNKNGKKRKKEG